jgi:ParB-like chromosome segregation protein Spo0J
VQGLSPNIHKQLLLTVGSHRAQRPLSPVEVGEAIQASLTAGSSLEEIAEALHLEGPSVLNDFLRLLRLTPEVRHVVDWGRATTSTIGFKAGAKLAQLSEADEQRRVCRAALQHRLSKAEIEQVVQLRKRSKKSIDDCIAEVLRMRPQVQQMNVFIGAVAAPKVRERLAALDQAQRDGVLRAVIQRVFPALKQVSCRLGVDGFTIAGGDDVSAALTQDGKDFEALINEALAEDGTP